MIGLYICTVYVLMLLHMINFHGKIDVAKMKYGIYKFAMQIFTVRKDRFVMLQIFNWIYSHKFEEQKIYRCIGLRTINSSTICLYIIHQTGIDLPISISSFSYMEMLILIFVNGEGWKVDFWAIFLLQRKFLICIFCCRLLLLNSWIGMVFKATENS